MDYNIARYSGTLELDKILEMLANEATLAETAERARELLPETDINAVRARLSNTSDAYSFMSRYSAPSFGAAVNVSSPLRRAEASGVLSIKELLDVAEVLRVIRAVKAWRGECSGAGETTLDPLFSELIPNKFLEDKLNHAIKSEEELNDNASPALYDIRRKITAKSGKIRETLEKTVRGPSAKYLQEAIITQRDGRYVVPVKSEYKGQINGIVHDTSATGSTLFIEPMAVVETNNEIRVLKLREQEEIERILSELSADAGSFAGSIISSYSALVKLDLIFAKARLAYKMKASLPEINKDGITYLKRARHPLINARAVVPITVELGREYDTLVITGPNTGGKTVTLKTIGLLTLMTMCGLMIPTDDGSRVAIFSKVFADIGDEQSIEQSLSTFSAHMKNIVHILNVMTPDSLVLFDELGAGTDPIEGAALANAVLEYVRGMGAKTVATTHYSELKTYALATDRVTNASCEFDVETLSPTYRLLIGVPGKSNAFAVSKRLGLSDFIIDNAKELISKETLQFEDVLSDIEKSRRSAETDKLEQQRLRSEVESLRAELKREREKLDRQRDNIIKKANEKAAGIIEKAKAETEDIVEKMRGLQKEKDEQQALRAMEELRKELGVRLKKTKKTPQQKVHRPAKVNVNSFKPGMPVLMVDLNDKGTILSIDKKAETAVIQMGIMKTTSKLSNLVILEDETKKNIAHFIPKRNTSSGGVSSVKTEIDLRGMMLEEALNETDMFLDRSVMAGLGTVTIIHGKGTGTLRAGIQDMLRRHPQVKSYRNGRYGEGENGVTVVELKNS